ncbi:MAG TPA: single-stranded DNA-binding protein, partial [Pyrinomonadaceae bacterium]|nr:single-stranded DNA-binding protein [Pyrinomonadaceae bacterium]
APVLNFNFATNEVYKDRNGNKQTDTTWYKAVIFGDMATRLAPYITRGKQLMIVGKVKAKGWTGENGEAKADLVLKALEVELLGGGRHEEGSENTVAVENSEELFVTE